MRPTSYPPDRRPGRVLVTAEEPDLDRVREPDVLAVVWVPPRLPAWLTEVDAAVRAERLRVPRTVLDGVSPGDAADWLAGHLQPAGLTEATAAALVDDVRRLAERTARLTGAARCLVRILTAAPTPHCGFHVDTVAPGAAPWGLVRVYNGAGTAYVEPAAVSRMREFYWYLGRRERVVRDLEGARGSGERRAVAELERERARLDRERPFVADPAAVATVPAGAVVAFTHLDAGRLWSDHDPNLAWIHCSPMSGTPRLVVNVTPRGRARPAAARGAGATAR